MRCWLLLELVGVLRIDLGGRRDPKKGRKAKKSSLRNPGGGGIVLMVEQ